MKQTKQGARVLVIGSGGREHALAWKLAESPEVEIVFVAPGNAGTAHEPKVCNVALPDDISEFVVFADHQRIDMTIVGPEAPLAAGIVDRFRACGLKIFGPTQAAAQLESSKCFAKAFMNRHGIPTAPYSAFYSVTKAHEHVEHCNAPMVIKADGLAAGKGAFVCNNRDEAHLAIDQVAALGDAGDVIIIEDCIPGEEVSFIVMCDGRDVLPLATSQDHKRFLDGDQGPNTGGMGAISPASVTFALHERIMSEIIFPTVRGMAKEGIPYTGFLYAGLMLDKRDRRPIVLEFNCRLGDPETQPIMMRLQSDLYKLFEHGVNGTLNEASAKWDTRPAVGVVLAAEGYPGKPRKGDAIKSLFGETEDVKVFHAGTTEVKGDSGGYSIITSGGRVMCVTSLGKDFETAQSRAYQTVEWIHFSGMQYRTDIGYHAVGKPVFEI